MLTHMYMGCSRGVVGIFAKEKELELMFINLGKQERLFSVFGD